VSCKNKLAICQLLRAFPEALVILRAAYQCITEIWIVRFGRNGHFPGGVSEGLVTLKVSNKFSRILHF